MNMLLREFRRRYQEVKEVVLVPAPGQGRKLPGLLQDLKLKCQREAELADFSLTVRPESSSHRHAKDKLLEATPRLGAKDVYVTFLN
ncbi:MAG: hypothetical protein INF43_02955 [Alphaproteobacteria bacterium]|nr:hypothetical protein [Alphaproteobacteria bacterium]